MTLTQAASFTKTAITFFIILVVLGIIGAVSYGVWYQYQLARMPKPEEQPEEKFGPLPALSFPVSNVTSSNYSYAIETTNGQLPIMPKSMKVYFLPRVGVTLLAPEKSKELALKLGFSGNPQAISATQYKFVSDDGGELIIDLATGNLHLKRESSASLPDNPENSRELLTDKNQIITLFKNYLSTAGLLPTGLSDGKSNAVINPEDNPANAQVSLWPSEIENYPIVTTSFTTGLVSAIFVPALPEAQRYARIDYIYWPIDSATFSTYTIKTAEQALSELKEGKGFISVEPTNHKVAISSIYLAYYQSEEYNPYLQPVYVFEGPQFAGIVPATLAK